MEVGSTNHPGACVRHLTSPDVCVVACTRTPSSPLDEKLHGISCGSSWRRTWWCLPKRSAFNAATSLLFLVMFTPLSVRLIIQKGRRVYRGGRCLPDLFTDAASIERSVGTKHTTVAGDDGCEPPYLAARAHTHAVALDVTAMYCDDDLASMRLVASQHHDSLLSFQPLERRDAASRARAVRRLALLVIVLLLQNLTMPSRCCCCKSSYLVDPASSHMLVSKIKPCMSKYKPI